MHAHTQNIATSETDKKPQLQKTKIRRPFNLRRILDESEYTYLAWAFFLPFALMLLIYVAMGVYPFGRSSVLVLDLNGQYVYFFEGLRDFVWGDNSLLYSFSRALGGEFMGIYAYYLASPLSYIVALFPKSMILEALFVMFLLKCGLSGLTFGFYIHKTRKGSQAATILFSTMYALSAYAIIQQHNTMWIDNLILLPLITYGLERLITDGKYKLFTVSLAIAVFSNFYIGYMSCIYVIIYFFYYYFLKNQSSPDTFVEIKKFFKNALRVFVFSSLAVGMAAVILFSTYYSLQFGKLEFSNPDFSIFQKFDFLDLFTKFFPGSYDTVRPEGWPFVYCGLLAIILMPLYFISNHVTRREKIAGGVLLLVFLLSFCINTFDMVWHGFQRPNWLNYRYSYMLCFLLLVFAFRVYERVREINLKAVFAICAIMGALLLVVQKLDYKNMPDLEAIWVSLICLVTYAIALSCAKRTLFLENTTMIITVLVSLELVCSGVTGLVALDKDVVISSYDSYHGFLNKFQPLVDQIKEMDTGFYRMEKTEHRKVNDPFALGFNGLSNSTSTLNSDTILFLQNMGLASRSHWSQYSGGTPVADSLLALKYLIANNSQQIPIYEPIATEGNYIAYKNPYALPLAFAVSGDIRDIHFKDQLDENGQPDPKAIQYYSPFERLNAMVTAMLGSDEKVQLFVPINYEDRSYNNVDFGYADKHDHYAPTKEKVSATVTYTFTAPSGDPIYCFFPSRYPREVSMTLNGSSIGRFFGNDTFCVKSLGTFSEGQKIELTLKLESDNLYIMNQQYYFYYLDVARYKEVMTTLAEGGYNIERHADDHFTGTISVKAGQETIYTSIPFDQGWIVKIDGKVVDTYQTFDALLTFDAEPGEHTLELRYLPSAFVKGAVISAVSVVLFVLIVIGEYVFARRRRPALAVAAEAESPAIPAAQADIIPDDEIFDEIMSSQNPDKDDSPEK